MRAVFLLLFTGLLSAQSPVINEFQPAPEGDEPEWVELYNPSSAPVAITGLMIGDIASMKTIGDITIPAEGYVVLSKDTAELKKAYDMPAATFLIEAALPSFNNTYDEITLRDGGGKLLDSAYYDMGGFSKAVSLERADPLLAFYEPGNMASCTDPALGTPGRENSISRKGSPVNEGAVIAEPNPFTPKGSKTAEKCKISYNFSATDIKITAKIFTINGLHIIDLFNSVPGSGTGEFYWDGKNSSGNLCDIGAYVLHIEALDTAGGKVLVSDTALVIGD